MCETGVHLRHTREQSTLERGTSVVALGAGTSMVGRGTAEEKLAHLRELILNARAMPMSASCVINRGEVLGGNR